MRAGGRVLRLRASLVFNVLVSLALMVTLEMLPWSAWIGDGLLFAEFSWLELLEWAYLGF